MTFAQPTSLAYQLCIHRGTVSADFLAQNNCKVSFRNAGSVILRTSADLAANILANYPLPLNLTVIALLMLGLVLDLSFPSCTTATTSCAVRLNADYLWHKFIKPADHKPGHGTIFVLANLIIWAIILCSTSKSSSSKTWKRSKYTAAAADPRYAKYRTCTDSDEFEYEGDANVEEQAQNINDPAHDRDEDIAHNKSRMQLVEIHDHETQHEYDSSAMTHKSSARSVPDPELHDDSVMDAYDEDEKYDIANPRNPDVEASSSSAEAAAFHLDPSHAPAADSISSDYPLQNREGCSPMEAISVSPDLPDHHHQLRDVDEHENQLRDVDEHENQLINKKCDEYINSVFDRIRKESISESF